MTRRPVLSLKIHSEVKWPAQQGEFLVWSLNSQYLLCLADMLQWEAWHTMPLVAWNGAILTPGTFRSDCNYEQFWNKYLKMGPCRHIQWLKQLSQCFALFGCWWHSITTRPNKAKVLVDVMKDYIRATFQIKNYVKHRQAQNDFFEIAFFCLRNFSASSYNIGDTGKKFAKPRTQRLSSYDFLKLCHRKHRRERVTVTPHAKHSNDEVVEQMFVSTQQISVGLCTESALKRYCCSGLDRNIGMLINDK